MRISTFFWAFFGIWTALTGPAAAQRLVAEIPYRIDYDGWITVPVMVNDQGPYDFIVDTGATLTVVFGNLAEKQDFPLVEGEARRILGLIEARNLPPRLIGRIETGGIALDDAVSVVISDWMFPRITPQGVLGLDFISRFIVEIDPVQRLVRFYEEGPPRKVEGRDWSRSPLRPRLFGNSPRPLYTVRGRVRRNNYPFILDLGASGTIVNYPALTDMLTTRRVRVRSAGTASRNPNVQDLFGNERSSRLVRVQRMKIGRVTWRNKVITVYNAEVFEELGVGDEPFGLLGADLFRGRGVVLDFPGEDIYITRDELAPASAEPQP